MKTLLSAIIGFSLVILFSVVSAPALWAQDLGPGFTKVKDGIYTYAPDATTTIAASSSPTKAS